jgi:tRNA A-37 threonylcarbamoyl transferase component Bud32
MSGPSSEAALADLAAAHGLDTVEGAFAFGAGEDLHKPGLGARRRTAVALTDGSGATHRLYLKRYGRPPLLRRLRRALRAGRPASPARIEHDNILAARRAGVPTMRVVAFGEEPAGAGGRSYLLVAAVPGDALERCGEAFCGRHAGAPQAAAFTRALARLVRRLHAAGFVHRDLYASHVFLDEAAGPEALYLIDLARMFAPRRRRFRWRVKDLAQLAYSMPAEWTAGHWEGFLREYLGTGDRAVLGRWDRAVQRKARRIRRHARRRRRAAIGGRDGRR